MEAARDTPDPRRSPYTPLFESIETASDSNGSILMVPFLIPLANVWRFSGCKEYDVGCYLGHAEHLYVLRCADFGKFLLGLLTPVHISEHGSRNPRNQPAGAWRAGLDAMHPIDVLAEALHVRKQRLTVYPKHVELLQGVRLGTPRNPKLDQPAFDV